MPRRKRSGPPTLQGERNYQIARGIFGGHFETDDEVRERVIRNALLPRFTKGQSRSVEAILSLAGSVEMFQKLGRFVITRGQAVELYQRKLRSQNKILSASQTREAAAANFFMQSPYKPISDVRPMALRRKGPKRAEPKHGSFKGLFGTKIIGAIQTDNRMNKFIRGMDDLIRTIQSIGIEGSGKIRAPRISTATVIKNSIKD